MSEILLHPLMYRCSRGEANEANADSPRKFVRSASGGMDVRVMALIPKLASGIDSGAVELSTHALFEVLAGRFFEASKIVIYDLGSPPLPEALGTTKLL